MNRSQRNSLSLAAVALVTTSLAGCRTAQSTRPGVVALPSSQSSSQPASPTSLPTTKPTGPLATLFHTAGGYCALCTALKQAQIDPETNRPITPPTAGDTSTGDGDLLRDLPR